MVCSLRKGRSEGTLAGMRSELPVFEHEKTRVQSNFSLARECILGIHRQPHASRNANIEVLLRRTIARVRMEVVVRRASYLDPAAFARGTARPRFRVSFSFQSHWNWPIASTARYYRRGKSSREALRTAATRTRNEERNTMKLKTGWY